MDRQEKLFTSPRLPLVAVIMSLPKGFFFCTAVNGLWTPRIPSAPSPCGCLCCRKVEIQCCSITYGQSATGEDC
jgi:hypothetical protein